MPGSSRIRPAVAADWEALSRLRTRWTAEQGFTPDDEGFPRTFKTWLEAADRRFWLAEGADEPVGMVNLVTFHRMPRPGAPPSSWGYIGNMYVVPELRGTGVSTALIDAVVTCARDEGFDKLVLHPSDRSRGFWDRAGFHQADELWVMPTP